MMMKKLFATALLCLFAYTAQAQSVTVFDHVYEDASGHIYVSGGPVLGTWNGSTFTPANAAAGTGLSSDGTHINAQVDSSLAINGSNEIGLAACAAHEGPFNASAASAQPICHSLNDELTDAYGSTSATLFGIISGGTYQNIGIGTNFALSANTLQFIADLSSTANGGIKNTLGVPHGGTGNNSLTTNVIYKGAGTSPMVASSCSDTGSVFQCSEPTSLGGNALLQGFTTGSAASTGQLLVLDASGDVEPATTSTTDGFVGIAHANAASSGVAFNVAIAGQHVCLFDGPTTAKDWVIFSPTVAGDCHDTGSATRATGQYQIGQVLSTNSGAGSYTVNIENQYTPAGGNAANPTASLGLTAVNGTATTYMRSDAAPALDQSISPTWTGNHTFDGQVIVNDSSTAPVKIINSSGGGALWAFANSSNGGGAQINVSNGYSATVPIYGFWFNGTTGIGNPAANNLSFILAGTQQALFDANGFFLQGLAARDSTGNAAYLGMELGGPTSEPGGNVGLFQYSNDTSSSFLGFFKCRSTAKGPCTTATANGDDVGEVAFHAWDGSNWIKGAIITPIVQGTVSSGITPMAIRMWTMNTSGVLTDAFDINATGTIQVHGMTTAGYVCTSSSGVLSSASTCSSSDSRLKNIEGPLTGNLAKIMDLRPIRFTYKNPHEGKGQQIGLTAQNLQTVYPELVSRRPDGYLVADYSKLTAALVGAVQELKAQNDNMRKCQEHFMCRVLGWR